MLVAALAVVLVDELVDGTKSAALPTMRHDLGLTYGQVGLLVSVPLLRGSLLELPLGVLAGHGRGRRLAVLGGGVLFILALVATAAARSFAGLLVAFVLFFPASGAFVSLTQSGLMDADPARREQNMARWELAGSAGAVAGPVLLLAVLPAGVGVRSAYLVLAWCAVMAWLAVARKGPGMLAELAPRRAVEGGWAPLGPALTVPPAAGNPARRDPDPPGGGGAGGPPGGGPPRGGGGPAPAPSP